MTRCCLHNCVRNQTTDSIKSGRLYANRVQMLASFSCSNVPNDLINVVILHLVKYAIGPNQYVVKNLRSIRFKDNLRLTCHAAWDSSQDSNFGFDVSKSPANREPAWEYSVGTYEGILFFRIDFRRLVYFNLHYSRQRHSILHSCLSLIDVASM